MTSGDASTQLPPGPLADVLKRLPAGPYSGQVLTILHDVPESALTLMRAFPHPTYRRMRDKLERERAALEEDRFYPSHTKQEKRTYLDLLLSLWLRAVYDEVLSLRPPTPYRIRTETKPYLPPEDRARPPRGVPPIAWRAGPEIDEYELMLVKRGRGQERVLRRISLRLTKTPDGFFTADFLAPENAAIEGLLREHFAIESVLSRRIGGALRTKRAPHAWPIVTRHLLPSLYDYLRPFYPVRPTRWGERHGTSSAALIRDIADILRYGRPDLCAGITLGRVKAVVQRYAAKAPGLRPRGYALFYPLSPLMEAGGGKVLSRPVKRGKQAT